MSKLCFPLIRLIVICRYTKRNQHSMRLPYLEVSQTSGQVHYPNLLQKMDSSQKDSNGTVGYYMTSPISVAGPQPLDLNLTKELVEALKPHGCFESPEELNQRMEVLGKLDALVKTWVRDLSVLKNMPQSVAETVIIANKCCG